MKANQLPKSDSYDSCYHSQSAGSQAKQTNTSQTLSFSANDECCFASEQDNKLTNTSSINAASNDANYLTYASAHSSYNSHSSHSSDTSSATSNISGGYKKAATNSTQKSKLSETLPGKKPVAEKPPLENRGFIHNRDSEKIAAEKAKLNNAELNNKNNYKQNNMTTTNPVSERIFMTSLLKHTGIALAIIIPLAAFSAYAATPIQPPANTNTTSTTSTATIDIKPDAIIYKSANEPTTVDKVDLDKYAGTWHEIGRLPMYFQRNCASDVTANYTEKTDGSGIIVTNKCLDQQGSQIVAEGSAKPADTTGSKLKVTFLPSWIRWLPVGRADYWVLARDGDYQTALVGTPDKKYLWLLARSPNVSQQTYAKYRQIAQTQGYDLKEFTLTPHANQTVKLIP